MSLGDNKGGPDILSFPDMSSLISFREEFLLCPKMHGILNSPVSSFVCTDLCWRLLRILARLCEIQLVAHLSPHSSCPLVWQVRPTAFVHERKWVWTCESRSSDWLRRSQITHSQVGKELMRTGGQGRCRPQSRETEGPQQKCTNILTTVSLWKIIFSSWKAHELIIWNHLNCTGKQGIGSSWFSIKYKGFQVFANLVSWFLSSWSGHPP